MAVRHSGRIHIRPRAQDSTPHVAAGGSRGYDGPPFRRDEAVHGEYRTKRAILEIYDEMQRTMETGQPYQSRLDPLAADPRVAHEPKGERK